MDRSLAIKTALVAALALALMVPVSMIRDLIGERQARRNEAVAGIALAYLAATLACAGLVAVYAAHLLRSACAGLAFGGALGALYGVLYVLLSAEDYALLGGAMPPFALLAAAMIGTRRVDWYQLTRVATTRASP